MKDIQVAVAPEELQATTPGKPVAAEDGDTVANSSQENSIIAENNDRPTTPKEVKVMLEETVNGIKDVASESYERVREWASTTKKWNSSNRSVDSGYTDGSRFDMRAQSERQRRAAARRALEDLMSPFMACHSGGTNTVVIEDVSSVMSPMDLSHLNQLREKFFQFARDDDTCSLDTQQEDEMMQLQRLTSWNTIGTAETNDTADDSFTVSSPTRAGRDENNKQVQITDDDGHVIPLALLETAQKRREKRRRNRIVRFEYPPISSLRECPRTNPDDIADLFFTEEELDEIEADRHALSMVDDVEIVAVEAARSPSREEPSPREDSPEDDGSATAQKPKRKPRASSPHPNRPSAKGAVPTTLPATPGTPRSRDTEESEADDSRLLSGIQIYLRERSTGKNSPR